MKHAHRFSPKFTLAVAICALMSGNAHATAATDAKTPVANPPVAKPMSAWLVGPSQASNFDVAQGGKGCLMVTEYDNGMILGVHAREAGIVGLTIDTRNNDLLPDETRQISINIGQDAYAVNARASDKSTLSVMLDDMGGGKHTTERLTRLGSFRLVIDDVPHHMATTGFTDGLARLQACMGGTMAVTLPVTGPGDTAGKVQLNTQIESMRVTSSGHETPIALAMPNLVPAGYRFVLDNVNPMTPISWQAGEDWVTVMRAALAPHGYRLVIEGQVVRIGKREVTTDPIVENRQQADAHNADAQIHAPAANVGANVATVPDGVWAGAKGQNLSDVLETWGLMSGVNVRVDLDGDYKLPADVRYEGRFDDAVQELLAQYSGDNRPSGTFLGLSEPVPAPVGMQTNTQKSGSKSDWRPSRDRVSSLRRAPAPSAVSVDETYQMGVIPDPANAPKTAKKSDKKVKTSGTWSALRGTTMRSAFEQWGADAGIDVVWLTEQTFPLEATVKRQGSFEDAVQSALSQFAEHGVQPSAQLNVDPITGQKALIIDSTRR